MLNESFWNDSQKEQEMARMCPFPFPSYLLFKNLDTMPGALIILLDLEMIMC